MAALQKLFRGAALELEVLRGLSAVGAPQDMPGPPRRPVRHSRERRRGQPGASAGHFVRGPELQRHAIQARGPVEGQRLGGLRRGSWRRRRPVRGPWPLRSAPRALGIQDRGSRGRGRAAGGSLPSRMVSGARGSSRGCGRGRSRLILAFARRAAHQTPGPEHGQSAAVVVAQLGRAARDRPIQRPAPRPRSSPAAAGRRRGAGRCAPR